MTTPTNPSRSRMAPAEAVRRVLAAVRRRRHLTGPGPDPREPERYRPRQIAPELHEAPDWIERRVDDLATHGALDEGHGELFDGIVDDLVEVWERARTERDREDAEHRNRLDHAEIELRVTHEWIERRRAATRARIAAADAEIARLLDEIDGRPE